MKKIETMISLLAKGLQKSLPQTFSKVLETMSGEFGYAIQKMQVVDPLIPSSVVAWIETHVTEVHDLLATVLTEFEKRGFIFEVTKGYLFIYGPEYPGEITEEERQRLLALGFLCRKTRDKAFGNRLKWWQKRHDYAAPKERANWSDVQIHREYPSVI